MKTRIDIVNEQRAYKLMYKDAVLCTCPDCGIRTAFSRKINNFADEITCHTCDYYERICLDELNQEFERKHQEFMLRQQTH